MKSQRDYNFNHFKNKNREYIDNFIWQLENAHTI